MRCNKFLTFLIVLVMQFAACALIYGLLLLVSLSLDGGSGFFFYDLICWGLMPLMGLGAALLVTLHGLNPYLAWFAPGISEIIVFFGLTGLLPSSPGMPMLTMLMGLVGAASGEVLRGRKSRAQEG